MDPQTNPNQTPASPEAKPVVPETAPAPAAPIPPAPVTPPASAAPTPAPAPSAATPPAASAPATTGPVIADDVDVIEKEWVDKAEQVVKANAEDPKKEEDAVEDLQIDYLKKRYGKDIKKLDQ